MKTGVMIGDSHSQLLFPFLSDTIDLQFKEIISKPGWSAKKFMSEGVVQSLPEADVVIVSLGGNNLDMNEISYADTIFAFLDILKTKFKRIVWIGPFYSTKTDVNYRHNFTNLYLKLKLPISIGYVETYDIKDIPHRDQVHFTVEGYQEIANRILPKVQGLAVGIAPRVWFSHPRVYIPVLSFGLTIVTGLLFGRKDG